MAIFLDKEQELLHRLKDEGWHLYSMEKYKDNIREISEWARRTYGDMLINYDWDIINCRWHGGSIELPRFNGKHPRQLDLLTIFAFREESDYTLLELRWAN